MLTEAKWHETKFKLEKQIRGNCIITSIRLEVLLVDIIYYSHSQQYIDGPKAPSLKVKGLTFGRKIERVKDLLKEYHNDLHNANETLFKNLEKFKDLRNQLSHCAILWGRESLEEFELWDVDEDESKLQFFAPIKFNTREIAKRISDDFNEVITPLVSLRNDVIKRLKQNHPALYDALISAANTPDPEK